MKLSKLNHDGQGVRLVVKCFRGTVEVSVDPCTSEYHGKTCFLCCHPDDCQQICPLRNTEFGGVPDDPDCWKSELMTIEWLHNGYGLLPSKPADLE